MKTEQLCDLLLESLSKYQSQSGDSFRKIAIGAGVTQTFISHIVEHHSINARNCFALKKLAKFLNRKGYLKKSYQEIFIDLYQASSR